MKTITMKFVSLALFLLITLPALSQDIASSCEEETTVDASKMERINPEVQNEKFEVTTQYNTIEQRVIQDSTLWLEKIKWVDFNTAMALREKQNKKIFMFTYTQWCEFCQYAENHLLIDDQFVAEINEHYIPILFDAETDEIIKFAGVELKKQEESGYHELPIIFANGKLKFPSMFFFNEDMKLISSVNGIQDNEEEFATYAHYLSSDAYLHESWSDYAERHLQHLKQSNE